LNLLVGSSKAFLYANGFLLLTITFVPFPTAVLAEYINTPQANIAVMFYSAAWLVTNVGFNIWWLSIFRPVRLAPVTMSKATVKRATIQIASGLLAYGSTTVISYWFPITALMIILGFQILWVVMSVGDERVM
jgi:TMEM175 potassium channel family protein